MRASAPCGALSSSMDRTSLWNVLHTFPVWVETMLAPWQSAFCAHRSHWQRAPTPGLGVYSNPRHRSKVDKDGLCRPCLSVSGPVSSIVVGDCGPVSGGNIPTPTKHRRSLSYRFVGSAPSSVLAGVLGHCQQSGGGTFRGLRSPRAGPSS